MKRFILLISLSAHIQVLIGACRSSGEAWGGNSSIRSVCFSRTVHKNIFPSPDRTKRIEVDENKGYSLIVNGRTIVWPNYGEYVILPIEFSWSPESDAFFVNDDDGSGMYSILHVFQVQDPGVTELVDFNNVIIPAFRKDLGCPASAADPAVWAIGWSHDGERIFAFAQATVNDSCGTQGDFRGAVLNLKTRSIEHWYSEAETRRVFRALLPHNMR